jgi:hypothetical protein
MAALSHHGSGNAFIINNNNNQKSNLKGQNSKGQLGINQANLHLKNEFISGRLGSVESDQVVNNYPHSSREQLESRRQ